MAYNKQYKDFLEISPNFESVVAVSYTHLDVYKRQKQQPAGLIACGLRTAALFSSSPSSRKKGTSLS